MDKRLQNKQRNAKGKPTLVFLHYFGGAAASWRWVIENLEEEYQCIAFDIPGFGGTHAPDEPGFHTLSDWLDLQIRGSGIENFILIGHSMGGKIAIHYTWKYPQRPIDGLILVAPSPPANEWISDEKAQIMKQVPTSEVARKGIQEDSCLPLTTEQQDIAVETALQTAPVMRTWWVEAGTKQHVTSELETLRVPVMLLLAAHDPVISTKMSLKETLPFMPLQTSINIHTRCGHLMPLEDPQWLASEIRLAILVLKG